jgi:serine/threonine protein kinase
MNCPNCGSAIAADARFCGECGQALKQLGKSLVEESKPAASSSPGPDLSGLRTIDDMETKSPRGDSTRVLKPGEVFAGRYEVSSVIGEGGMGVVYRAMDKLTSKDVALKLIRADRLAGKDAVQRLIREGVTSRDIRHSNVVAVYDVGEADGQPYMSMEFLDGQSLRAWTRQRLQKSADCSMMTAANIIAEILAGLEAAHKAGVVHRDLKPENVMLMGEPNDKGVTLKILDFGVARAAGGGDTGATSLGTRGYMAPEQITAPDAAQPAADLYSLSVMFYELLVGVLPQGHWQPPSGGRSDVPAAVDRLIERGLSNSPRMRPQSVAEYGKALAEAMNTTQASNTFAPWLQKLQDSGFKPIIDQLHQTTQNFHTNTSGGQMSPQQPAAATGGGQPWAYIKDGFTKNFINGKGRASRAEYWWIALVTVAVSLVGFMIDYDSLSTLAQSGTLYYNQFASPEQIINDLMSSGQWFPTGTVIALVVCGPPALAVTSRRLHDMNITGWVTLVAIIPTIGQIASIVIGLPGGTAGDNKYGPNPLRQKA